MSIRLRINHGVLLALACVAAVTAVRADQPKLVQKVYSVADLVVPIKDCDAPPQTMTAATSPAAKCADPSGVDVLARRGRRAAVRVRVRRQVRAASVRDMQGGRPGQVLRNRRCPVLQGGWCGMLQGHCQVL